MDARDLHYAAERLLTDYVRCIDTDRLEEWPDFFAEQCLYQITTASNAERGLPVGFVYADSRNMLIDRIAALRQANIYEAHRYRHLVSGIAVLCSSDLRAVRLEASFLVVRTMQSGASELFCTGQYRDIVDFGGKTAKFREKRAILDSDRIDTLLAMPV